MQRFNPVSTVSAITAGNDFTVNFPLGLTYKALQLVYVNLTLAQIKNLVLEINGKPVQTYKDAAELDKINQYYGRGAAANGVLTLFFIRPELTGSKVQIDPTSGKPVVIYDRDLTAIGTADIQTLQLKGFIDEAAVAPTLKVNSLRGPQEPLGLITKVKSFPRTFATTGQQDIDTIPRGNMRLAAVHAIKSDVSAIEFEADSIKAAEGTKTVLEELQSKHGRTPQSATMTTVDFLLSGDILDAMPLRGVQDMHLRPTIDTNGEVRTVVEYLDGYEGI